MSNISDMQKRARDLRQKYEVLDVKNGHSVWGGVDYAAGFVGDVGELVELVMAKEGRRHGEDVDMKMRHELGDCLWSLLVIADRYDIDLEKAFNSTMDELDERLAV